MSIAHLLQRPVTIVRINPNSGTDDYGNPLPAVEERTDAVAYLEQTDAAEALVGGTTYSTDWFIALPAGTKLDAWDRVEVPDMIVRDSSTGEDEVAVFEVVGYPDRTHRAAPDGEHHVEANMRMVNA
jgi:hypothetical protein